MTEDQQIAQTIIQQMGGMGRLVAMIGARDFVAIDQGLQFGFKGCRKANKCQITLTHDDTYTLALFKFNNRTWDCPEVFRIDGAYWDMLKPVFEQETGLYLSL